MQPIKYLFGLLFILALPFHLYAQPTIKTDFYDSAKYYDFSKLWHADSVLNLEYVDGTFYFDPKYFDFAEPLGFIGDNFQRFYIHFTSVKKSRKNPYQYFVVGKTKVKDNICKFNGTITIDSACFDLDTTMHLPSKIRQGYIKCTCTIRDGKHCKNSGVITGIMASNWCLYDGQICYDNINGVADGFSNNQFEGQWKSYSSTLVKKCNWGDGRIPDCGDLDIGAGEFFPNEKYLNNGWQDYREEIDQADKGAINKLRK